MKKGICALCKEEKDLVNSHIIPERFYSKMYNSKGNMTYASKLREKKKPIQNGLKEFLLCKRCDGVVIGEYDKYAIEVIRDRKHVKEQKYSNCLLWSDLDYNKFKLFHLSVLWRAHIAKKFFKGVNLSEEVANEIRGYILSGEAPDEYDYPVFGLYLVDYEGNHEGFDEIVTVGNEYILLNAPYTKTYAFIYHGIAWNYVISKVEHDEFFKRVSLREDGNIILQKENIYEYRPFCDLHDSIKLAIEDKKYKKRK